MAKVSFVMANGEVVKLSKEQFRNAILTIIADSKRKKAFAKTELGRNILAREKARQGG